MSTTANSDHSNETTSSKAGPTATKGTSNQDTSISKVVDDVKTLGQEMKNKTKETGVAIVESAKEIASDSRELASQTYEHTRERVRDRANHFESAARERITAEPIKSVAWALGIGFILGRFIFNGRS